MSEGLDRVLGALTDTIVDIRFDLVDQAVADARDIGAARMDVVHRSVLPALDEVGARLRDGRYFLPDLLMASDLSKQVLMSFEEDSATACVRAKPIILGTVAGDIHDIGKGIVGDVLSSAGWEVLDLGVDRTSDDFTRAIEAQEPLMVGLSAMMTTVFGSLEQTVAEIKKSFPDVPVVIGGAPVTQAFADEIGADGYGSLATDVLDLVDRLGI